MSLFFLATAGVGDATLTETGPSAPPVRENESVTVSPALPLTAGFLALETAVPSYFASETVPGFLADDSLMVTVAVSAGMIDRYSPEARSYSSTA